MGEQLLAKVLVDQMQGIFGKHQGYRTTHAKGLLVEGVFTPTPEARTLSLAPHFSNASTPIIARFSVGGGMPVIADTNNDATPKGIAIRFNIDGNTHTDLISHSFNGFATKTGEGFSAFLTIVKTNNDAKAALAAAQASGGDVAAAQQAVDQAGAAFRAFLQANRSAAVFVTSPKPNPINFGTLTYYEPNTHVLTNEWGATVNVRYRLMPAAGHQVHPNDPAVLDALPPNYLEDDLRTRFPRNPIVFNLQAHIAGPTDVLDDATIAYTSKDFVPVGRIEIRCAVTDSAVLEQQLAFSPAPENGGVQGMTSSQDPLIQIRKAVYYISTEQRRSETRVE